MVELSKSIANKIREKQGDITEDEVNIVIGINHFINLNFFPVF